MAYALLEPLRRLFGDGGTDGTREAVEHRLRETEPPILMTYDFSVLRRAYDTFTMYLPGVSPYYAVKCNPDIAILKTLASLGSNFDCASLHEMEEVLGKAGVSGDRVIFAHTVKAIESLEWAKNHDVRLTTVDCVEELEKLAAHHPECSALLRIEADDPEAFRRLGEKFGAIMDAVPGLLVKATELGVTISGVAFHVGSGCSNPMAYYNAIERARHVFRIAPELGHTLDTLDIGGGFQMHAPDDTDLFSVCAAAIRAARTRFFADLPKVRWIAEPGRFLVEHIGTLYVRVDGVRDRGTSVEYHLADGMYGHFGLLYRDGYAHIPRVVSGESADVRPSRLYGPTCDSHDIVMRDVALPKLGLGEFLAFDRMGAYAACAATTFNGFDCLDVPAVVL